MTIFKDFYISLLNPFRWVYATWIIFLLKYRKTVLGPFWIIVSPMIFVAILGGLYGAVFGYSTEKYVPHLGIGLIVWSFISSVAMTAPRLFIQNKAILMQGLSSLTEIILKAIFYNIIIFAHQLLAIIAIIIYFQIEITAETLLLVPALILMIVHALWVTTVLGILGARFRDIGEIVEMVMRIVFLATPVIWLVDEASGQNSVIGTYLLFNPFYHVLEPVRGAFLGTDIIISSWFISSAIAIFGIVIAANLYQRFRYSIIFWL